MLIWAKVKYTVFFEKTREVIDVVDPCKVRMQCKKQCMMRRE